MAKQGPGASAQGNVKSAEMVVETRQFNPSSFECGIAQRNRAWFQSYDHHPLCGPHWWGHNQNFKIIKNSY